MKDGNEKTVKEGILAKIGLYWSVKDGNEKCMVITRPNAIP